MVVEQSGEGAVSECEKEEERREGGRGRERESEGGEREERRCEREVTERKEVGWTQKDTG